MGFDFTLCHFKCFGRFFLLFHVYSCNVAQYLVFVLQNNDNTNIYPVTRRYGSFHIHSPASKDMDSVSHGWYSRVNCCITLQNAAILLFYAENIIPKSGLQALSGIFNFLRCNRQVMPLEYSQLLSKRDRLHLPKLCELCLKD